MPQTPAYAFINSSDPLSEKAMTFLLNYKEEDVLVDYKVDFNPSDDKDWLNITIDVMAFANTYGGYLVFGIKDKTYEHVGVTTATKDALTDINLVLQKLNRFVKPEFTEIRSKEIEFRQNTFVILHIPESKGLTHIAVKNGSFRYPSGKEQPVIRQGMVYLRYSGKNQILNPEGMSFIVNKNLDYFKETLFEKIAKVVESPVESQVLIISHDKVDSKAQKFMITDAPDAILVKGMSFSVSPSTDEELIASWIALFKGDQGFRPPIENLWRLYVNRHILKLSAEQLNSMALFCLLTDLPIFFWLQTLSAELIKKMLMQASQMKLKINTISAILHTGAFLGDHFYTSLLKKLGNLGDKLAPHSRKFPVTGPREFFIPKYVDALKDPKEKLSTKVFNSMLEDRLTEMAKQMMSRPCGGMMLWKMQSYDCYLYARDDQYR